MAKKCPISAHRMYIKSANPMIFELNSTVFGLCSPPILKIEKATHTGCLFTLKILLYKNYLTVTF